MKTETAHRDNLSAAMRQRQRGRSVIELAVVCAIAMILMTVAIPSLQKTMDQYNLRVTADAMAMQISLARSRAVVTNSNLTFTFTTTDYGLSPVDTTVPRMPWPSSYTFSPVAASIGSLTLSSNGTISPARSFTITSPGGSTKTISILVSGKVTVS